MKLISRKWFSHNENALYSVDIQPSGDRIATAGASADKGGLIVIWNARSVIGTSDGPHSLCRLENHAATVNCVRWSKSGENLASCSDDFTVMIWRLHGKTQPIQGSIAPGFSGAQESEIWRCIHTLRGHSMDVLHLSWSPNDLYLASCGVDNKIIIWNINNLPDIVRTLTGHTGHVKGLAFDPLGSYLASQSDDKSVKIWAISTWTCIKTITKPFETATATTFMLRLDWSPDGNMILTAHSMNNDAPVAQTIYRQNWELGPELVGHRKAVTCVIFLQKFAPRICRKHVTTKKGKKKTTTVVLSVVGSKDRRFSLWASGFPRPLFVADIFGNNSVMDIAWSYDLKTIIACSHDGMLTILLLDLDRFEIVPYQKEETDIYLKSLYGRVPALSNEYSSQNDDMEIIQNSETIEARLKITEIEKEFVVAPEVSLGVNGHIVQKHVQPEKPAPIVPTTTTSSTPITNAVQSSGSPLHQKVNQLETRTKDGKRRIAPTLICATSTIMSPRDDPGSLPKIHPAQSIDPVQAALCVTTRLLHDIPPPAEQTTEMKIKRQKIATISNTMEYETVEKLTNAAHVFAKPGYPVNLPVPDKKSHLSRESVHLFGSPVCFSIDNGVNIGNNMQITTVKCMQAKDLLWETLLDSPVLAMDISRRIAWFCCENRTLNSFSVNSGAALRRGVALDSKASMMTVNDVTVMVLTQHGTLTIWNEKMGTVLLRTSVDSIWDPSAAIDNFVLTDLDMPIIRLSNGRTFTFGHKLGWMELTDSNSSILHLAQTSNQFKTEEQSLVHSLFKQSSLSVIGARQCSNEIQRLAQLSLLESKLQAALLLKCPDSYKQFLYQYVVMLVKEGFILRIKELFDSLLGPIFVKRNEYEKNNVLGIPKKKLLMDLLPVLSNNSKLEQMFVEYSDAIRENEMNDF